MDAGGNVFIAETGHNRILRLDTNGIITSVAGNGLAGYLGDNALITTNVMLDQPSGVAAEAGGNLYIADSANHRIRRINPAGLITTIAGGNSVLVGDGGPATSARLLTPASVAVDATGDLLIADSGDSRIRKVTFSGPNLAVPIVNATNAGTCQVIVSGAGGSVTSSVATLTVDLRPFITQQPASQVIAAGGNATFRVTGDGPAALTYQWRLNGTNLLTTEEVQGTPSATLALNQVTAANGGNYDVILSDAWGSVTSHAAVLAIAYPPAITSQPVRS